MKQPAFQKTGPALVLLSGILFSFGGLIIKLIPWSPLSINAARNLIAVIITVAYIKKTGKKFVFNKSVILSGLAMAYTTTVFCIANKMTTAANTILLQFTSPVFVILLCLLIWKQRPDKRDVIMCLTVFIGVGCFFYESVAAGNVVGDLLALSTGLTYAVIFISNRMEGGDAVSTFAVGEAVSTLVGLPFLLQETQFSAPIIGGALAFGCFLGFGYILMSQGLKYVKPIQANLISALEPVLNPVWVAIFYGETVSGLSIAGFVIVLVSVLYSNIMKSKDADPAQPA